MAIDKSRNLCNLIVNIQYWKDAELVGIPNFYTAENLADQSTKVIDPSEYIRVEGRYYQGKQVYERRQK